MATDETKDKGPFEGPFGEGEGSQGGFLDELRSEGEKAVSDEIAGLQAAMERVDRLAETVRDADLDALKSEWMQIQSDLKRALQSGLAAAEEGRVRRPAPGAEEELRVLEAELARKNELIGQLSDTLKRSTVELDEKDRRVREEARALRDRAAEMEEDLEALTARVGQAEGRAAQVRVDLDAVTAERDALERRCVQAEKALETERAHQRDARGSLEAELNEARLQASQGENARRDLERRVADLEKRLEAADAARSKAEESALTQSQEAGRAIKEARTLGERLEALETELKDRRDKSEKEIKRLRREGSRNKAQAEALRARVADATAALGVARNALEGALAPEPDEEPT